MILLLATIRSCLPSCILKGCPYDSVNYELELKLSVIIFFFHHWPWLMWHLPTNLNTLLVNIWIIYQTLTIIIRLKIQYLHNIDTWRLAIRYKPIRKPWVNYIPRPCHCILLIKKSFSLWYEAFQALCTISGVGEPKPTQTLVSKKLTQSVMVSNIFPPQLCQLIQGQ